MPTPSSWPLSSFDPSFFAPFSDGPHLATVSILDQQFCEFRRRVVGAILVATVLHDIRVLGLPFFDPVQPLLNLKRMGGDVSQGFDCVVLDLIKHVRDNGQIDARRLIRGAWACRRVGMSAWAMAGVVAI
jgi:hypothetical protein